MKRLSNNTETTGKCMVRLKVNTMMTACGDVLPSGLTVWYNIMRENNASGT